jgi:hypothetical protein
MHPECHDHVARTLATHPPKADAVVIEVGARDINGGVRHLLPTGATYTGLDTTDGPGVDTIADARTWQPARKADLVLCLEVLEHADDWPTLVTNMAGWVKRRGRLIITAATHGRQPHSAIDGGPLRDGETYENIDPDQLAELLPGCEIEVDHQAGDVRCTWVRKS